MKILSIDVGIKNLAFCLFSVTESREKTVLLWDTVNLSQPLEDVRCQDCLKVAKFTKHGKFYCLKHAKKKQLQIPTAELKPTFISKQKLTTLYELANKYNIQYTNPIKKADLIALFNDYIFTTCLEPIEKVNASTLDLVTIGRNLQIKMDAILVDHILSLNKIIIENQISPIANRMKTIQGMIAQYFIMRNSEVSIDFVNAANKLKDCPADKKSSYPDRKKLSIEYSILKLNEYSTMHEWLPFFNTHSKKDDLADSFLQGLWFIQYKLY